MATEREAAGRSSNKYQQYSQVHDVRSQYKSAVGRFPSMNGNYQYHMMC